MHVRNIQVRRNGVLKPTHTYVLTFNTPILPKKIKAAYLSVNVEVYIPNPLRCYNCQVFGHHEDNCLKKPICGNCGGEKHCSDVRNCNETAKCANCNGNHPVSSRDCPSWKKEKEILTVKYKRSLLFYEARKIIEEQLTAPGKSYASITKGAGVRCTDAQTQTDLTYDIQLTSTASGGNLDKMQAVVRPLHPKKVQEAAHALHKNHHLSLKRIKTVQVQVGPSVVTRTMHQKENRY